MPALPVPEAKEGEHDQQYEPDPHDENRQTDLQRGQRDSHTATPLA